MCSSPVIDSRHRITSRNKAQLIPDAIFARSSYIKDKMVSCLLDSKYYLYRLLIMADPEIQRLQIGGLGSKRHVNEGIQGQRILGIQKTSVTNGNDCKTSKTRGSVQAHATNYRQKKKTFIIEVRLPSFIRSATLKEAG